MQVSATLIPDNAPPSQQTSAQPADSFWGEDGFGFDDILDAINPLQRIPIVSSIYRDLTGDVCSVGSKVLGGALFGGIIGTLFSFFDVTVKECTGMDVGENMLTLFTPEENAGAAYRQAESVPPESRMDIAA